jgi:hypothetical protein
MSMGESTKFLAKSPYIKDLAMMVIGYGMAINIVEVTWKSKLKAAFPDPNSYSVFMGNFSSLTGVVTLLMMIASRTIFKVKLNRIPTIIHGDVQALNYLWIPPRSHNLQLMTSAALWLGCCSPDHTRHPACHWSHVFQFELIPRLLRTHHGAHRHHPTHARRHGGCRPKHLVEGR